MPTVLPPPKRDPRSRSNLVAILAAATIFVLCLWLFHALGHANAKLNCVVSGRLDCDHLDE
jgi:hypothetical protein